MDTATLRAMQALAVECWRIAPETVNVDSTVGEIAWVFAPPRSGNGEPLKHRLWYEGERAVAWGVISPPTRMRISEERWEMSNAGLVWQVHPEHAQLLDDVLDWFAAEAPGVPRETSVRTTDASALPCLETHGYKHDASAPWGLMNMRDVRDVETPKVPAGYVLKTMADVRDIEKRVAVHRASWEPSSLTEEKYAAVMSAWPYRPELDFVVEAPDGTLACSALGWYDEVNRVGEFEPVGTHPEHRRLGLASNLMLFGMLRFRDAGATHAIVGCRGDADYPVPKLIYESIGFRELSRDLPYVLSP
jgi:ribosomal protein S18 acetylase RimI-like enzyme